MLTDAQVEGYHRDGFVWVSQFLDSAWLDRLRNVTEEFVERSRSVSGRNPSFDLEPDHSPDNPRLRRLNSPVDHHPTYWEFASRAPIVDAVCDLIGPDIKFHHSKLNFKASHGGEAVKWHQDIGFWPHTNYSPLTVGVFLAEVSPGMGEVGFVPGSHDRELFDHYDGDRWTGSIRDAELPTVGVERAVYPTGPAGTITIHNCRTVHGSAPNASGAPRPLLLNTYTAADAFAYTDIVRGSAHGEEIIRGEPARWARHDSRPCQVGPGRYRPIFEVQQGE